MKELRLDSYLLAGIDISVKKLLYRIIKVVHNPIMVFQYP